MFVSTMVLFCCNVLNVNPSKCVSMNNQERKIRTEITNIKSNEPSFYPYSVKISKCSGSWYTINDTYAKFVFQILLKI